MVKNVLIYVIVIAVVVAGIWLFSKKGSSPSSDIYSVSASPTASVALTATPAPTVAKTETRPNGLKIEDLVIGTGATAKAGDTISVHYTGWLTDGTKFDSSVDRGQSFDFSLGAGQVIKGWDEGVAGVKGGGKRGLTIPA